MQALVPTVFEVIRRGIQRMRPVLEADVCPQMNNDLKYGEDFAGGISDRDE